MTGYLEAVDDRQGCSVRLDGESVYVNRARLGEHLHLAALGTLFDESESVADKAAVLFAYFERLDMDIEGATPGEVLAAYVMIRHMNQWRDLPAWLRIEENEQEKKPRPDHAPKLRKLPTTYEGRFWAFWVHKIASFYHWSRDTIFNLWPEEAALYIQEILVDEYYQREDRRALSRVSYRVDKISGMGQFIPSPKPAWMVDEAIPEPVKYQRSMLPVGSVEASYTHDLFQNGKSIDDTQDSEPN